MLLFLQMDSDQKPPLDKSEEIIESKELEESPDFEQDITKMAFDLLINSQTFKQPRMDKIMRFERLYYNDVPPKFRQISNVVVPVFSGLIDTLLADLNDEVQLKFASKNPQDWLTLPKIQAHWEAERDSLKPNAMWNQKARWGRFNAMLSGRDIQQIYAESDPEYRSVLETINYSDFHCQALGGGDLENHLFAGREGIYRTIEEILNDESYPKAQRDKIKGFSFNSEFWQTIETTYGTKLQRFRSQGLDADTNSMTGDATLNLCRFIITYKGKRYKVLFEPCSQIWLDVAPWEGPYPWKTYATHEDHKLFWSKSFADDFFEIAQQINILINQEITNREKSNFNARAFDPTMYKDVQKLDRAQYDPDTLVPFDSAGGNRKAADGIYTFQVQGLNGTIDLTDRLMQILGNYTGANELSLGGSSEAKKPTVVIAQQQQLAKRIGFRSDPMKEMWARAGMTFVEGMEENMPSSISINILGENGFIEEHELTRSELKNLKNLSVSVISTSEQESADNIKRDSRVKAIEMVAQNPNLSKYEKETIYRDVGNFDESAIAFLMNEESYESRKQIGHASKAIQSLLLNKIPEVYYGADDSYLQYIQNWMIDHKTQLKAKYQIFTQFINAMVPIAYQNVLRQKKKEAQEATQQQQMGQDPAQTDPAAVKKPVQSSMNKTVRNVAASTKR